MGNGSKYIKQAQEWLDKPEQEKFHGTKTFATLVLAEYLAQQDDNTIFKKEKKK